MTVVTSTFTEEESGEQGRVTESRCGAVSKQVEMQICRSGEGRTSGVATNPSDIMMYTLVASH